MLCYGRDRHTAEARGFTGSERVPRSCAGFVCWGRRRLCGCVVLDPAGWVLGSGCCVYVLACVRVCLRAACVLLREDQEAWPR